MKDILGNKVIVALRPRVVEDAERFFHILDNDNFHWFGRPSSVDEEREFLAVALNKTDGLNVDFTVLYGDMVVGAIGIKRDAHKSWKGELGYFIDETYWNMGIATLAVMLCEKEAVSLGIKRIEIVVDPENLASINVAKKSGYMLDAKLSHLLKRPRVGGYTDGLLYSKIL